MKPGEALATTHSNRAKAHNPALWVLAALRTGCKLAQESFSGTVAELLARLNCMMSERHLIPATTTRKGARLRMRRSVRWPKAPSAPGSALRHMASNLRAVGIDIQFSRADIRGRRVVSLA